MDAAGAVSKANRSKICCVDGDRSEGPELSMRGADTTAVVAVVMCLEREKGVSKAE